LDDGEWRVDEAVRARLLAAAELVYLCTIGSMSIVGRVIEYIPAVPWPGRWLVDCVFGNPFRPVALDPGWLRWNHGTVPAIARRVYDDRAWHDLPILADALMDAGCDNDDVLAHCRSAGPHVRGCWVVDLLLERS